MTDVAGETDATVAETEWISAQVPKELARAFRELARSRERTVSAELRLALRDRLALAESDEVAA